MRAFTAADRKTIKQAAENYPETEYYKTDDLLTQLGIGEALVTALNEKGIPTPLVHTMLVPPRSRMDVLTDAEIDTLVNQSKLAKKYANDEDRESACEILTAKLEEAAAKIRTAGRRKAGQASKKEEKVYFEKGTGKFSYQTNRAYCRQCYYPQFIGCIGFGWEEFITQKSNSWF